MDTGKKARHQVLIDALKTRDIKIMLGKFKKKRRLCKMCNQRYPDHEEKYTDVNIALTAY